MIGSEDGGLIEGRDENKIPGLVFRSNGWNIDLCLEGRMEQELRNMLGARHHLSN